MVLDWTRFRGPNGTGVAEGRELPVDFGPATGVLWQADVPAGKASPVLTESRVYLTAYERGELLMLAIDRSTGDVLWRREAPARRLETMHRLNDEASPTPVTDGTFNARDWAHYRARCVSENSCMAVRLGGRGDVTRSHVLWRHQKSLPDVESPILYRGVLYLVRNGGTVTALDPVSGKVLKQDRRREALDGFYAPPVAGDGKGYMVSDTGKVAVVAAGKDWRVLRTNDLGESVYATPAIGDGCLYIRTATRLYCFGGPSGAPVAARRQQASDQPRWYPSRAAS